MSHTEHHSGIIIEVAKEGSSLIEKGDYLLAMHGIELFEKLGDEYDTSYVYHPDYFFVKDMNMLFKIEDHVEHEEEIHFYLTKKQIAELADNNGIPFAVSFYNGGGSLDEVLEPIVKAAYHG